VPSKADPVATEIDHLNIKFTWLAPNDNFGTITGYIVKLDPKFYYKIAHEDNTQASSYVETCDSTTEITSQLECQVPLSILRQEPWSLEFDDLIQARVQACNLNGCSEQSDLNTVGA